MEFLHVLLVSARVLSGLTSFLPTVRVKRFENSKFGRRSKSLSFVFLHGPVIQGVTPPSPHKTAGIGSSRPPAGPPYSGGIICRKVEWCRIYSTSRKHFEKKEPFRGGEEKQANEIFFAECRASCRVGVKGQTRGRAAWCVTSLRVSRHAPQRGVKLS